jgi:hypothetical protein
MRGKLGHRHKHTQRQDHVKIKKAAIKIIVLILVAQMSCTMDHPGPYFINAPIIFFTFCI